MLVARQLLQLSAPRGSEQQPLNDDNIVYCTAYTPSKCIKDDEGQAAERLERATAEVEARIAATSRRWAEDCAHPTAAQWTEENYKMMTAPWVAWGMIPAAAQPANKTAEDRNMM